jgi:hypothetical protein
MMAIAVVDEAGLDFQRPKQGKHLNTSERPSVTYLKLYDIF